MTPPVLQTAPRIVIAVQEIASRFTTLWQDFEFINEVRPSVDYYYEWSTRIDLRGIVDTPQEEKWKPISIRV